ncbi:hypothetical protein [Chelativorans sp. M5D2P16]|uniref:hypothetical protein n=1 Tax=Chelativorans sp. M5D2P16 TaxID=3095678 RepID=UPI002ACA3430|nr:hypothetical protein [Chelativorans sp. M5D2P16]MDZ5699398.1 hypothetical protein [Chelativorans sp. M5D2P16]
MDKLPSWRVLFAALIFAIFAGFGGHFAASMRAERAVWSFAEYPHPSHDERTLEERARVERLTKANRQDDACTAWAKAEFDLYQRRYPAFLETSDLDERFRRWKFHIALDRRGPLTQCLSAAAVDTLIELPTVPTDLYFCGRFSRRAANAFEEKLVGLMEELFVYAQSAIEGPVDTLLLANELSDYVELSPDVAYYFHHLTTPIFLEEVGPRDTSHLDPLISRERRAFLRQAAEERDLEAVLETMPSCPLRLMKDPSGERL